MNTPLLNKVLDVVLELQKMPDDARGYEFQYDGLEYYLSILFEREVVPTPTPQDLPQEYKRKKDVLRILDVDVFDEGGREVYDAHGIVKLIEDFYN